jgi:N6-L-threonylcarbamoyladenine synthase
VCLTVSGWHNEIYHMSDMWNLERIGATQDDAAGEAFDKVAKMMWLGYPGGPIVSKLADAYTWKSTKLFPRVFLEKSEFGFSFSGLKSAVKREVDKRGGLTEEDQKEISYEFQSAVNEVLTYKILEAAKQKWVTTVLLAGWVSANDDLRARIQKWCDELSYDFFYPTKKVYCMDNAAMIWILTYYRARYHQFEEHIGTVQIGKW